MDTFTVVFDACVLYPAPLRDVLIEVGMQGIFRPRWTDDIHDEWISHILADRKDITPEALARTRKLMDSAIPDCLITGHRSLVEGLHLPDADDRHVLAAAIIAKAAVIVTYNTRDFPAKILDPYGIEAQHPDDFLVYQFDLAQGAVCQAIKRLRARLKKPPMDVQAYLDCLTRQRLPQFVQQLRKFESLL